MEILFNSDFLKHNIGSNYEGPYRIQNFRNKCNETFANGEEFITLVHSKKYKEHIKKACFNNETLAEIHLTPESYEAAKLAVGLTIHASENGDFAAVRPPGHHACKENTSGFCLFNNIAIATQKLVNDGKKVAIIDIDAHHGNGTQEIFYDKENVYFISIHQALTFPFTGQTTENGINKGLGFTLNMPLLPGSDDKTFLSSIDKAIAAVHDFKPDVVGISAGFDGYYKDKMMNFDFSLKAFYECGFKFGRAFNRVFAVLEGGYHDDIFQCVTNFVDGVNVGSRPVRNTFDHDMSIG